jgi:diguanylate cyclase (GGDEF)-like protein/PAS domain S-box-containing protein
LIGVSRDATERKKAEEALGQSEEQFRLAFENAKDAIFWADPKTGLIVRCNKAAENLLERKREDILKKPHILLHPPDKAKCYARMFKKHIQRKGAVNDEAEVMTKSGKIKPVHITAAITSLGGRTVIQGIFRDVTERKQAQRKFEILNRELLRTNKRLKQLALIDSTTTLYNHRYLSEHIEVEFQRAKRYNTKLSVIMLDLDYFKSVNDIYGHEFGDLVLVQLAKLLKKIVRTYDMVIRFGGEEFVIVSPGIDRNSALNLAQRILNTFNLYNFGNRKHKVKLKLSIAVASYPEDRVIKGINLIEIAECILNKVKELGGNRLLSSLDIKEEKQMTFVSEGYNDIILLQEKIHKLTKRTNESLIEAIFAFAKAIELKDHYTGEHVERTVEYSTRVAKALGLSKEEIENIRQASILHDLGKIGISEKILRKRSKLNFKERDEIRRHPQIAADILRPIHFLHSIIPLILYHHARWDGRGYPDSLEREDIPIGARIIAIADVYQALISDRPYRKAFTRVQAVRIIRKGSGTQFDPHIVNVFINILNQE